MENSESIVKLSETPTEGVSLENGQQSTVENQEIVNEKSIAVEALSEKLMDVEALNEDEKAKDCNKIENSSNEEEKSKEITADENNLKNAQQIEVENKEIEISTEENGKSVEENVVSAKEKEYIEMVFALESEKQSLIEEAKSKIGHLRKELEELFSENEKLKKKNSQLEQNLVQKEATGTDTSKSKNEDNDILTKAKTLLFEKTKVCKQQEQHVSVLKTQVDSIKEVLNVTKEMLNLRNIENDHLQQRLETIDLRFKAEKERQNLLERKLDISKKMYDELRKEYDLQSNLHKEIKFAYEQKIKVLDTELKRIKANDES